MIKLVNSEMTNYKAWSKATNKPAEEFPLTPLPILAGKIPEQLRGSLYRNGPGRLQRGGFNVGHWFDGDGAILAVHFGEGKATATYRYVQTEGYQKEREANRFLFPNYGMTAPGFFWNNWGKDFKNCANTSVLALPNRLLALWEAGHPYSLDLHTLETWGIDNLSSLTSQEPFSAHPKIDPETGNIFNFGVTLGKKIILNLYQSDSKGNILKKNSLPLERLSLIHDFAIAGPYLVFFIPPIKINLIPVLLGFQCFSDALKWKPELATQILIFDRDTLSLISRGEAEPWYQWHYANGCVESDGSIAIEIVRYPDFTTNQNLKEIATGKMQTPAKGTLWQIRLNPQTGQVITARELSKVSCDFPVIPQHQVGKSWRYTYLSVHRNEADIGKEIFGGIARFDHRNNYLSIANLEENYYPSEPIFVAEPGNGEQGWVLTVVYDGNQDKSEVRIYDSEGLENEPICRLELPKVIPPSFHGIWKHLTA